MAARSHEPRVPTWFLAGEVRMAAAAGGLILRAEPPSAAATVDDRLQQSAIRSAAHARRSRVWTTWDPFCVVWQHEICRRIIAKTTRISFG